MFKKPQLSLTDLNNHSLKEFEGFHPCRYQDKKHNCITSKEFCTLGRDLTCNDYRRA
jgi:hypothetical protein